VKNTNPSPGADALGHLRPSPQSWPTQRPLPFLAATPGFPVRPGVRVAESMAGAMVAKIGSRRSMVWASAGGYTVLDNGSVLATDVPFEVAHAFVYPGCQLCATGEDRIAPDVHLETVSGLPTAAVGAAAGTLPGRQVLEKYEGPASKPIDAGLYRHPEPADPCHGAAATARDGVS
jgi:hypothetical protein